jgi:predicted peptidase
VNAISIWLLAVTAGATALACAVYAAEPAVAASSALAERLQPGPSVGAHARESGFLDRAVTVEGREYKYEVYVPRVSVTTARLPVILALHGGGQYGTDGISQTAIGFAHAIRSHPERFPALVVFPQSPPDGTPGFQGLGGRIAFAALDKTMSEYSADETRVYLTGLSMGGNGAWYLAFHHPERFAAALIVCGFIGEFTGRQSGVLYPPIIPGKTSDPYRQIAERLAKLPIWIFHGDADPTVSVEVSRHMAAALKAVGADVRYTELPGVEHNAWNAAYERQDVIAWLLEQRKQ